LDGICTRLTPTILRYSFW